jgi:uncharacterized protein (TIGR02186 family)
LVRLAALLLLAGLAWLATAGRAGGQELIADLADHQILISTGFTGTEVFLFGAIDGPGDIAVVIEGPPQDIVVRRREPTAGIWINRESVTFVDVPSFYRLATNRPMEEFATPAALERQGIGIEHLRMETAEEGLDQQVARAFRRGLVRNMQDAEFYGIDNERVTVFANRLFRTRIKVPPNVPTGQYIVRVYLFREDVVVAAQTTPLRVTKIGVGARMFRFATSNSAAYGGLAIAIAVLAGWMAGVVFPRS